MQKAEGGNMIDDGTNPKFSFFQQMDLITPDIGSAQRLRPIGWTVDPPLMSASEFPYFALTVGAR
jgi:hypothetical protein